LAPSTVIEIGSVLNEELFPERLFPVIFPGERGLKAIREATEASLESVDMSMIKASDSVNILASHHSFLLLGGEPYAEVIRTVKDVVPVMAPMTIEPLPISI